ncbi:unnamed protein product [Penicillium olsonii]|nr:unnamed protein product [Penicillium olsonii]CAG7933290.1 unnamed protein product [Penicillium olsonii]
MRLTSPYFPSPPGPLSYPPALSLGDHSTLAGSCHHFDNMNHTRSFASCAQVLRQVFIAPTRTSRVGTFPLKSLRNDVQFRSFQQSHRLQLKEYRPPIVQAPRNEAIGAPFIHIVNEEGSLGPKIPLLDALDTFDRNESFLVQVRAATDDMPPICKIHNKKEHQKAQKLFEKAARANKSSTKQVELNWAIDAHDLSHRLKQLQKFLEKDHKVEIVLTTKRRKRNPTVPEIKHVVQSVLDTIQAAGARQTKEPEGELGKQLKFVAKRTKQVPGQQRTGEQAKTDIDAKAEENTEAKQEGEN